MPLRCQEALRRATKRYMDLDAQFGALPSVRAALGPAFPPFRAVQLFWFFWLPVSMIVDAFSRHPTPDAPGAPPEMMEVVERLLRHYLGGFPSASDRATIAQTLVPVFASFNSDMPEGAAGSPERLERMERLVLGAADLEHGDLHPLTGEEVEILLEMHEVAAAYVEAVYATPRGAADRVDAPDPRSGAEGEKLVIDTERRVVRYGRAEVEFGARRGDQFSLLVHLARRPGVRRTEASIRDAVTRWQGTRWLAGPVRGVVHRLRVGLRSISPEIAKAIRTERSGNEFMVWLDRRVPVILLPQSGDSGDA